MPRCPSCGSDAAIRRVTGVSESWLQDFANEPYAATPREPGPLKKSPAG